MNTEITPELFSEIHTLVTQAKQQASVAVNTALTQLYWQIGQRINQAILGGEHAKYGKQIVATLAWVATLKNADNAHTMSYILIHHF